MTANACGTCKHRLKRDSVTMMVCGNGYGMVNEDSPACGMYAEEPLPEYGEDDDYV